VRLALEKAVAGGHEGKVPGSVLASDGFFPFRDSIDLLAEYGVTACVQPGGSIRDKSVREACNEHGISMAFTGERCFRHF
jgi:phosphoribosylaminoimidazolecarboxamide formyltransferase/IMP cyclohydrolase